MKDYIFYIDTDSLYIGIWEFLKDNGVTKEQWDALDKDTKIEYILKISKVLEKHVDDEAYEDTQVGEYNSAVAKDDFSVVFKQEIVCERVLFVKPKKYGYRVVNNEGVPCNKVSVTGLEIIRSETPSIFKVALNDILGKILDGEDDELLEEVINKYRKSMKKAKEEEVSENKGVKGLGKWLKDGRPIKGTPYHVKGAANYHFLLNELGISDNYEHIEEGNKCKVCYVKKNRYGIETITYQIWPKEFEAVGVEVDYQRMIDKFFIGKCDILLDPMNRQEILDISKKNMNLFF